MIERIYAAVMNAVSLAGEVVVRLPRLGAHRERFGLLPEDLERKWAGRPVVWVHAASVGELLAVRPLLALVRERLPGRAILLSATSLAGRSLAAGMAEADAACLLPIDAPRTVRTVLDRVRPEAFVFTETELWPNLLRELEGRGIPAVLVSGRVSAQAFARYRRLRPLFGAALGRVACLLMQSEEHARRIRELGAPPERVEVGGDLKVDGACVPVELPLEGEGPVWVAGSTRPGEEEVCLQALRALRRRFPGLRLLLAPRHLDRVRDVEQEVRDAGFRVALRSRLDGVWAADVDVLVLDTIGELSGLYGHGTVAFVGGTLVPVGGHNLLEPARLGVPVLYGPSVENVKSTAERLEATGGGRRVTGAADLEEAIAELLSSAERRQRMGRAAAAAFATGGAAERSFERLRRVLERDVP